MEVGGEIFKICNRDPLPFNAKEKTESEHCFIS